jgi:hypothetical protein
MTIVALIVDLALAGLLIATIVLAVRLHRRLEGLRGGHEELRALVGGLNDAIRRSQVGILELKMIAEATSGKLQEQVKAARRTTDELSIMVASANNLADRLAQTGASKATVSRPAEAPPTPRAEGTPDPGILRALRDVR